MGKIADSRAAAGSAVAGPFRWWLILALCVIVLAAEGYDIQAMAFAAPLLAVAWGLPAGTLGVLLTASVAGIITGSLLLAPLGDKIGRRVAVLLGVATAAGFTLGCALAPTVPALALLRTAAGLGLGMAMPNIVAIAMESAPPNQRTLAVIVAYCGYPLGAATGGILASRLVGGGFSTIFLIGGGGTLVVFALCLVALPETWTSRLARSTGSTASLGGARPGLLRALLAPERVKSTLLFWVLNFAGAALVYFFVSWLPTLLSLDGLSGRMTLITTSLFNAGGVVGGLTMGFAEKRFRIFPVLAFDYGLAIAAVLGLALLHGAVGLMVVAAMAGVSIVGSQLLLIAAVNQFYPPEIRVGASGVALGIGRMGAILAPLVGGLVLAMTHSARQAVLIAAVPATIALVAALSLALMDRSRRRRATRLGEQAPLELATK